MHHQVSLRFLFFSFLKIGATAFGGFMALISTVENVFVNRNRQIDHRDMVDGISLASMLPGAVAVNVVAFVGYRLRGVPGVLVSVVAVTLPSFFLILALAYLYERWGTIPAVTNIFNGFLPAVCAVISATAWNLGRKTVTGWKQGLLLAVAALVLLGKGGFLVTAGVVVASGVLGLLLFRQQDPEVGQAQADDKPRPASSLKSFLPVPILLAAITPLGQLGTLFAVFAGMSLMLFGGGYVFIPLIQEVVVDNYGWVTQREFVDSIAMGQITPGPILISAAFIGYKVASVAGAMAATIGIFAPSVVLMVLSSNIFTKMQKLTWFQAVLSGIRPAVIGLIAAAAVMIARSAPPNYISMIIFSAALFLLIRFRVPVAAIILPAGITGWLVY